VDDAHEIPSNSFGCADYLIKVSWYAGNVRIGVTDLISPEKNGKLAFFARGLRRAPTPAAWRFL
jgi:hypothetical protein